MKKSDFLALVAKKAGISQKEAAVAVAAVFSAIEDVLAAGDKQTFAGFGSFEVRERGARKGRNIHTGEPTDIPACRVPVFHPNVQLKEKVNQDAAR